MDDLKGTQVEQILTLVKDNNRLLHKMHRNALWGGWLKFILYVVVLVAAPLWLYATYLAPIMEQVLDTYREVQGTGAKAQAQFSDLKNFFKQFNGGVSSEP